MYQQGPLGHEKTPSPFASQGYLTALLGNIMLLSYFLGRKERSGATIQAVGIATNVVVLTQVLCWETPTNMYDLLPTNELLQVNLCSCWKIRLQAKKILLGTCWQCAHMSEPFIDP